MRRSPNPQPARGCFEAYETPQNGLLGSGEANIPSPPFLEATLRYTLLHNLTLPGGRATAQYLTPTHPFKALSSRYAACASRFTRHMYRTAGRYDATTGQEAEQPEGQEDED